MQSEAAARQKPQSANPLTIQNQQAGWRATVTERGIVSYETRRDATAAWQPIAFRSDAYAGPQWFIGMGDAPTTDVAMTLRDKDRLQFEGRAGKLLCSLRYASIRGRLALVAAIRNDGPDAVESLHAGLRLGLDTYMSHYPQWLDQLFPTLMRCEKTHFWGYAMSPRGRILGIASPDPVASYHFAYNDGGHRIYTISLDLLNPLPLPARHPQDLHGPAPAQSREWTIFLGELASLDDVKPALADWTGAPMIDMDRYTVEPGQTARIAILAGGPVTLKATPPGGETAGLTPPRREAGALHFDYQPKGAPGVYTLTATGANGKTAEARLFVRRPWSWYLQHARKEAIRCPQKASSHIETYYGCFSQFLAQEHFPDPALDAQSNARFEEIYPLMFDPDKKVPKTFPNRIQNTALTCSILVDRFQATGDLWNMEQAAGLADFLLKNQDPKTGAYKNGNTHYTSVAYVAKSILETALVEKELSRKDPIWAERYQRHYESARRAIDDLERSRDNVQTEGEMTFEDGMISCTCLQLGMFALLQDDPALRAKCRDAALDVALKHRCLSQILIPDCRMNGATLRFWESQYDVKMTPNMMNSPHGWSAWRIYGIWYLYLLTGQEEWLRQTMNALGSCVQLIDTDTGRLRWAFVPDPYIEARVFRQDPARPGKGVYAHAIIGEQYVDMISDWYQAPPNTWVTGYWGDNDGGCCDNDVHEIFKCLEEVALTSAYVVERPGGELAAWNCTVESKEGALSVSPAESIVEKVHLNLQKPRRVTVRFGRGAVSAECKGIQWMEAKSE